MALKSLRITKKELQTYYTPKVSDYEMMVNSINSPMGFGQIIQSYNATETGVEVTNTYYHVYEYGYDGPIIIEKTSGAKASIADAGMTFWNVGSNTGIDFLNGVSSIPGLRKLKYCDGCLDGNGLNKPVIDNFSKRFKQVNEMVLGNNLLEGFLFYDLTLPRYSNVFPAIKKDDGVNVTYQFKNVNTGTDLTPQDVAVITDKPVSEIETSVDTAPVIKPQEGANTIITSCCDESIFYVIAGQYTIGNILYTEEVYDSSGTKKLYCWFVESLTKELPTLPVSTSFTSGGRSCQACTKLFSCPIYCETLYLSYSTDPTTACVGPQTPYEVDWSTSTLYLFENCGGNTASIGYYGDGKYIYYWDGVTLSEYQPCPVSSDNYLVSWCCDDTYEVISSPGKPLSAGQIIFFDTNGAYPVNCWYVKGSTQDGSTITGLLNGATYEDCYTCQSQIGQFCKR